MAGKGSPKSGLKTYEAGEIIFHENERAESLFIIQTGQMRLYRPKGRGFIDLAVLRAGEVVGEMAYFDEKNRRRSCSAAAIITTEVIEISFQAFEKTIAGLNPWLKIIISTLVDRLKATNEKVKSLEPDSVGFKQGKIANYIFFHVKDVMKILSTLYLVIKNYGEDKKTSWEIHVNKIKFFMFDVYNLSEVKYEEFSHMLNVEGFISLKNDEDGLPKILSVANPEEFRKIMVFFNQQRMLDDEKQLNISFKCEQFLRKILDVLEKEKIENPTRCKVDISAILQDFKTHNIPIVDRDLTDAIQAGLVDELIIDENKNVTSTVNYKKLKDMFSFIHMMNAIKRINEIKATNKGPKAA